MLGSPTVLANEKVEIMLTEAAKQYGTGLYVPSGALWGGEDIRKMSDLGSLKVRMACYNNLSYPYFIVSLISYIYRIEENEDFSL